MFGLFELRNDINYTRISCQPRDQERSSYNSSEFLHQEDLGRARIKLGEANKTIHFAPHFFQKSEVRGLPSEVAELYNEII